MGSFGRILGGALQGIGAGMVEEGKLRWQERREAYLQQQRGEQAQALEATQHTNKIAENEHSSRLRNWEDSEKTKRTTSSQITIDSSRAKTAEELARQKQVWDIEDREDKQDHDLRKARVDAALDQSAELAKAKQQGMDVFDVQTATDGTMTAILRNGTEVPLKSKGQPRATTAAGSGGVLDEVASGRAAGGAAPRKPALVFDPAKGEFVQSGGR